MADHSEGDVLVAGCNVGWDHRHMIDVVKKKFNTSDVVRR